jgi:Ca2+-binding EF-hand superfamily protein
LFVLYHSYISFELGRLDPKEFRSCLIACGYNIREDRQGDADFQRIMINVDPAQTGFVTFESFLDFMTRECSEEDNVDQLTLAFKTLAADKVSAIYSNKLCLCLNTRFEVLLM